MPTRRLAGPPPPPSEPLGTHLVCELVMHTMDALRPRPAPPPRRMCEGRHRVSGRHGGTSGNLRMDAIGTDRLGLFPAPTSAASSINNFFCHRSPRGNFFFKSQIKVRTDTARRPPRDRGGKGVKEDRSEVGWGEGRIVSLAKAPRKPAACAGSGGP